jgi:T-complex protein 1 subunit theta
MNKIIVNHLEKIFVTSDASTITKEMEVHHPAAKLIVMASNMQETEVGDGTNFLIILVGELLKNAENLINMGLHTSDIISGYEKGARKALEEIETMSVKTVDNPMDFDSVAEVLKCAIASKMYGDEEVLADLCAEACIGVCDNDQKFDVDNIRVLKVLGGTMNHSEVIKGFVAQRGVETSVQHVTNAKIAVYNIPFDPQEADTKGTVLLQNAAELMNYTRSEEELC